MIRVVRLIRVIRAVRLIRVIVQDGPVENQLIPP